MVVLAVKSDLEIVFGRCKISAFTFSMIVKKKMLLCFCESVGEKTSCDYENVCETDVASGRCYYSERRFQNGQLDVEKGCGDAMHCAMKQIWHVNNEYYCCDTDFCNGLPPNRTSDITPQPESPDWSKSAVICAAVGSIIGTILISMLLCLLFQKRRAARKVTADSKTLQQRTMAQGIELGERIGRGSYGEVYAGTHRGENVAVKKFYSNRFKYFEKEKQVYAWLRVSQHPNILQYRGDDDWINPKTKQRELWLVTECCAAGSLFQYLSKRPVENVEKCLKMCLEIVSALDHLHYGAKMTNTIKYAIAHRDLKPSNILLRQHGGDVECVLGDFGASVSNQFEFLPSIRRLKGSDDKITDTLVAGTVRYMAPEVLTRQIGKRNFETFKASDIYSLGLLLWEIGARTIVEGHAYTRYVISYSELGSKPRIADFIDHICVRGKRPDMPVFWQESQVMLALYGKICECWHSRWDTRVAAANVKKFLFELQNGLPMQSAQVRYHSA